MATNYGLLNPIGMFAQAMPKAMSPGLFALQMNQQEQQERAMANADFERAATREQNGRLQEDKMGLARKDSAVNNQYKQALIEQAKIKMLIDKQSLQQGPAFKSKVGKIMQDRAVAEKRGMDTAPFDAQLNSIQQGMQGTVVDLPGGGQIRVGGAGVPSAGGATGSVTGASPIVKTPKDMYWNPANKRFEDLPGVSAGQAPEKMTKQVLWAQSEKELETLRPLVFNEDGSVERINPWLAPKVAGFEGAPFTKGREMRQSFDRLAEAAIRNESGAAVPPEEIERFRDRFMPSPFDSDTAIRIKFRMLESYAKGAYSLLTDKRFDPVKFDQTYHDAVQEDIGQALESGDPKHALEASMALHRTASDRLTADQRAGLNGLQSAVIGALKSGKDPESARKLYNVEYNKIMGLSDGL